MIIGREKKGTYEFREEYLADHDLILNIVQGGMKETSRMRSWSLERDHIFPQEQLKRCSVAHDVDDVGNLQLLVKSRNSSKRDRLPEDHLDFFGGDDAELRQLLVRAREDLNQTSFSAFVDRRHALMKAKVIEFLGF